MTRDIWELTQRYLRQQKEMGVSELIGSDANHMLDALDAHPKRGLPEDLTELEAQVRQCTRCKLSETRRNVVFGEGNHEARLVFVGEAPGRDEDLTGRPFVGAAGKLLTRMIEKMGLTRPDVYICNVLKCRPPQNRNPEPDEIEQCRPYLEIQLRAIQPVAICALGNFASQTLLDTKETISRLRGRIHAYGDIPLVPTFHPAALIYHQQWRFQAWEDLKLLMGILKRNG